MRLLISHDAHGTISAVCVPGESLGGSIGVLPQPGHSLSVVDLDEAMDDRKLGHIAAHFLVHVDAERPRLVRRETPSKSVGQKRGGSSHVE
jgi:hypothetical protein